MHAHVRQSIEDIDREVELLMLVRGHENVIELRGAYEDHQKVSLWSSCVCLLG